MFQRHGLLLPFRYRLPHAGGGVSRAGPVTAQLAQSSPRRWGCFPCCSFLHCPVLVFPTQVGVFPNHKRFVKPYSRLPHAGGGVSSLKRMKKRVTKSSPRRWGCFYTDHTRYIANHGLPHAGGGVSTCECPSVGVTQSSPRRWGCFSRIGATKKGIFVFPTQVGVFLPQCGLAHCQLGLPHAGGGVSDSQVSAAVIRLSSPRRWGCFLNSMGYAVLSIVFPTQVGVFPKFLMIAAH